MRRPNPLLLPFFGVVLLAVVTLAAEWPQWRGPERDGHSPETNLLDKWPEGGPPQRWKATGLGEGFASVAVADGRIYTQGQRNDQHFVIALEEKSGKKLWETPYGSSYGNRRGNGPRGTPVLDGGRLYAMGANGHLLCLDAATGKILWQIDFPRQYRARNISWGWSESPLIDGEKVIANPGAPGASVVALDKHTGKVIWKALDDESGYSSPMPVEVGGIRHYVVLTGEAAVGVEAETGKLLWRYDKVSNRTANVATPVVQGNLVFLSTDYGTGCALLQLAAVNGGVKAEEAYFNRDMKNHYSTSVLVDGVLYGYSSSILTAMNLRSGAVLWKDRAVGKGQVIYADRKLYLLSEDGTVGLAEANPKQYVELSRFSIGRGDYPMWALPAIANGTLYLRDQDRLLAYDIRESR